MAVVETSEDGKLELSSLLLQLADELRELREAGRRNQNDDVLEVTEASVELGLTWTIEGNAGVKFWVVDLAGASSRERSTTITVTLKSVGADRGGRSTFMQPGHEPPDIEIDWSRFKKG
jgi:DNA helicase IV